MSKMSAATQAASAASVEVVRCENRDSLDPEAQRVEGSSLGGSRSQRWEWISREVRPLPFMVAIVTMRSENCFFFRRKCVSLCSFSRYFLYFSGEPSRPQRRLLDRSRRPDSTGAHLVADAVVRDFPMNGACCFKFNHTC